MRQRLIADIPTIDWDNNNSSITFDSFYKIPDKQLSNRELTIEYNLLLFLNLNFIDIKELSKKQLRYILLLISIIANWFV